MASATPQGPKLLYGFRRIKKFDTGLGAQLPPAYKKFWQEWKVQKPTAVHYIPKKGNFERNEITGEVKPIQNIPIPLLFPPESNDGIWGGEGVIKGFQKRQRTVRRVPHFWVPVLRRSVVYSEILNKYLSMVVTDRTINLIHESFGFDHYLLKNLACDLQSTLALKLKRKILQSLQAGCPELADNPEKQSEVLKEYKKYLDQYKPEEIEWYGLTYTEAIYKIQKEINDNTPNLPHKIEFRQQLIAELKRSAESAIENNSDKATTPIITKLRESSWFSKINPFAKKQET